MTKSDWTDNIEHPHQEHLPAETRLLSLREEDPLTETDSGSLAAQAQLQETQVLCLSRSLDPHPQYQSSQCPEGLGVKREKVVLNDSLVPARPTSGL
jgi:hypothetical protein